MGGRFPAPSGSSFGGSDRARFLPQRKMARTALQKRRLKQQRTSQRGIREVVLAEDMTLREVSVAMGVRAATLASKLAELTDGTPDLLSVVDLDVLELVAEDLGVRVKRRDAGKFRSLVRTEPPSAEEMAALGYPHRAPIVTVMGHVDHGKTTLMDALRGSNVASKEAGGITQGVAAFSVSMRGSVYALGKLVENTAAIAAPGAADGDADAEAAEAEEPKASKKRGKDGKGSGKDSGKGKKEAEAEAPKAIATSKSAGPAASEYAGHISVLTVLDTPGHALFSSMRRRGAALTDVVVLVVDGKDGPMPQTEECVKMILEEEVPVVVAMTKCDVYGVGGPDKAPSPAAEAALQAAKERVGQALLGLGLVTEGLGGDVPIVPISAKTGFGMQELKDALALQAEMADVRAQLSVPGEAVVVDAKAVKGAGVVVDAVVRWGTLRVGDVVVAGTQYGRVKALQTDPIAADSIESAAQAAAQAASGKASAKAGGANAGKRLDSMIAAAAAAQITAVKEAPAGVPVRIMGFRDLPRAGDDVLVVESEERAKCMAELRTKREAAVALEETVRIDTMRREAAKKEYQQKRVQQKLVKAVMDRERQRHKLRKAGAPMPEDLILQDWEKEVIAMQQQTAAAAGSTGHGLATSQQAGSRRQRAQGNQQRDISTSYSQLEFQDGQEEEAERSSPAGSAPVSFIVKADSAASLVAMEDAFARIRQHVTEVFPRMVSSSVGEVTEKEVETAGELGACIVAFNSRVSSTVQKLAEKHKVPIRSSRVIYHLLDEVCDELAEHMEPTMEEEEVATAEVKALFPRSSPRKGEPTMAIGCVILEGTFPKNGIKTYRVIRGANTENPQVLADVRSLFSLQYIKDSITEAKKGQECGMSLNGFDDLAAGDRIVAIKTTKVKPKLRVHFD
jgi:translation initiation factor IF-2